MRKLLLFSLFALLASAMSWAATETWVKVTSQEDLTDGDYLIVCESKSKAFDGSSKSITEKNTPIDIEISSNTISLDDKYCFTISKTGDAYSIISKSGSQIGTKNAKRVQTGSDLTNTIVVNSDKVVITSVQVSGGKCALQYNPGSSPRFCYYTSSQTAIALYKKQVNSDQVAAPTFSVKDGATVNYGSKVTVSSAEGTNLYYSLDGGSETDAQGNTAEITLPSSGSTCKISAYATDNEGVKTKSETVTVTYNLLNLNVSSIKDFLSKKGTTLTYTFTNPVTVVYQNGDNLYVKDNTGSLLIRKSALTGLANGDIIEAGLSGAYDEYFGLPQLKDPANLVKSETAGTAVEPTVVTIDELALVDYSEYVSLKKVKYDGKNLVDYSDDSKTIVVYDQFKLNLLEAGKVYNVTGFYSIYNTTVQILPLTAEELQYVADVTVSPAFGDLPKGSEVTISCATEGAVLNGTVGETTLENEALPYTFTASEVGDLKVAVKATKEGLEESEPLSGTYKVYQPKVDALKITPAFGTIEVGTVIKISCATEDAVLNGTFGETTLKNEALPYTFTASELGTINIKVTATKEGFDESEPLDGTFTVKAAAEVDYSDKITATDFDNATSYKTFPELTTKGGAFYKVTAIVKDDFIQFNTDKSAGVVMTVSKAGASKLIITWNKSGKGGLEIYGKNTPYSAVADLNNNAGELIETVLYSADGSTTVDLGGKYNYIGIKPITGASYVTSFEFIWNKGAAGGDDVTYTKASEAKAGNFAVLATAEGKAVGRNADLNPVDATVADDAIALSKNQAKIDEFEIVENGDKYQLCGGLSSDNSRRFLTYDAAGVTTTAATVTKGEGKDQGKEFVSTADANADVTFESTTAGLLVKFNDGEYLMFNGTKFVKGAYTEVSTQAEGEETLTPVIVFLSSSNVSTGVDSVEIDENAEAQYFNLNGVQVKAENLTPGLYIVRQGNKVSKQVIR